MLTAQMYSVLDAFVTTNFDVTWSSLCCCFLGDKIIDEPIALYPAGLVLYEWRYSLCLKNISLKYKEGVHAYQKIQRRSNTPGIELWSTVERRTSGSRGTSVV